MIRTSEWDVRGKRVEGAWKILERERKTGLLEWGDGRRQCSGCMGSSKPLASAVGSYCGTGGLQTGGDMGIHQRLNRTKGEVSKAHVEQVDKRAAVSNGARAAERIFSHERKQEAGRRWLAGICCDCILSLDAARGKRRHRIHRYVCGLRRSAFMRLKWRYRAAGRWHDGHYVIEDVIARTMRAVDTAMNTVWASRNQKKDIPYDRMFTH